MLNKELTNDVKLLHTHLSRRFEPFFQRIGFAEEDLAGGNWLPPLDVHEDADRIVVTIEIPGMKEKDIDITFGEGVLTIKGERKFENDSESRKYHRIERVYGSFSRSFTLPRSVDPEHISAAYNEGVLEISIPKREDAKPRQIRIEVK